MNLQELSGQEFEVLVGLLLKRTGHEIVQGPGPSMVRGPDYQAITPDGQELVVEVKHFRRGLGKSQISQFIGDLDRYRMQNPSAKGLLVLSSEISQELKSSLRQQSHIDVWDGINVQMMLSQHPDISNIFQSLQASQQSFISQVAFLTGPPTNRASELCSEMRKLPCGTGHWKDYERICTEILTYVFSPDLAAPEIQSRSDDGLDIIDAIFPIRSNAAPWSIVRAEYRTRFAVAEFKNYCDPIGQRQVESIAQYLWDKAHRTFGILVSRKNASQSAAAQRRRQWLESGKMIVLLSDDDLCEMLNMKESGGQPFDIIDSQLEDFLRTLTP